MSSTNRRFVIAYVLLVGLPLAGLAGVLRTGRHLVAPVSIDGTWKVDSSSIRNSGQTCEKAVSAISAPSFAISQSGKTVMVTLHNQAKTSADGALDGNSVKVQLGTTDSSVAGCAAGQPVTLMANVDPKSEPRSLSGVVSVDGCASCGAIEFHAVRQPKSQAGGAH